jgi:hypothetical protein
MPTNIEVSDLIITPVTTRAGRDVFIRVPFAIYGPEDNWVPPLFAERHDHLNPAKNPYFLHADVRLWVAYKAGRPVGRISAQICQLYLKRYDNATGHFGFLEAIDDRAVFKALLETAQAWLGQNGMKHCQGPFNFSINEEMGLLIEGFDTPPSLMMGHAKPYYARHLEALGYVKATDVMAYDSRTNTDLPRAARLMVDRAAATDGLTIRPFRKNRFEEDIAIVLDIFNEAWSNNWGYVPMTDAEIKILGKNLKMLVRGDYIQIAELKGRPVAMAVTMPNVNAAIADLNGRLFPFGLIKLIWRLKIRPPKSIRLVLMGVRKEYHGTRMGAVFALSVVEALRLYHSARGTFQAEHSWVLEDNMPMRRMIEALGGWHYKTYRIYQTALPEQAT